MLSASMLLTTSCNNDSDDDDDNNPEPAFTFDCTYMKVKEGSKLTTKNVSFDPYGGSSEETYVSEVVEQGEVENTVVAVFEGSNGLQSFVTCEGEKFIVTAQGVTIEDGVLTTTEDILLELDMGRPVGDSYEVATIVSTTTVQGQSFQTFNRYVGQVVAKDLTMDVEGTSYSGVVQFEMESYTSSSTAPGTEFFTSTTTYYMAPEVSTIKSEIYDETQGYTSLISTLISYEY